MKSRLRGSNNEVVADILEEVRLWRSAGAREETVFRRRSKERQSDGLA